MLSNLADVKPTPASEDRLVAHAGKVPVSLQGADFEFVTKAEIKKVNDEFASAAAVPLVLPEGLRKGVQDRMDIEVDTADLGPGRYHLILSQLDGKPHDVPINVLPAPPVISNLPFTVHQGVASVSLDLKGERLDLLKSAEISRGSVTLGAASAGGTVRPATFHLSPGIPAGTSVSLRAAVVNRNQPLAISDALSIVAPQPVITSVTLSPLPAQTVHLNSGELPGGLPVSVMLQVAHLSDGSGVRLECEQTSAGILNLQLGQPTRGAQLTQLTPDQLFVTFDTGGWVNGCAFEATVTNDLGNSTPHRIGRIVAVPTVELFSLTPNDDNSAVTASFTGRNLETMAKVGWTPDQSTAVAQLPQPLAGGGFRQQLQLALPLPPAPGAPLYLWLRGESKARVTTLQAQ